VRGHGAGDGLVGERPQDRGHLETERVRPGSAFIDPLSTREAVALFAQADLEAARAVEAAGDAITLAVDLIAPRLARGGRLLYVGAGTSGRLGVLDAVECPPTFQSDPEQVQALLAGGDAALVGAVEGAEDDAAAGAHSVRARDLTDSDVVCGIAAGGTTPFVHGALREARRCGAGTVFVACVPQEQAADEAEVSIRIVTGPELVAGSTRLKAGSATKMVLNALTTLTFARLGKVHEGRMVDVDTSRNHKLVDRGARLIAELGGVEREAALELLEAAGGRVKVGVLLARGVPGPEQAEALLLAAGGSLGRALERLPGHGGANFGAESGPRSPGSPNSGHS